MIELDPPGFRPLPRPMAGDEGSRAHRSLRRLHRFQRISAGFLRVAPARDRLSRLAARARRACAASPLARGVHAGRAPRRLAGTRPAGRDRSTLASFNAFDSHDEWLFLSLHPAALMDTSYGDALLAGLKALGLPPQRVVLEVSEQAGGETTRFAEIIDALRKSGFLIALDGFGAKHSNIDPRGIRAPISRALQPAAFLRRQASTRTLNACCPVSSPAAQIRPIGPDGRPDHRARLR